MTLPSANDYTGRDFGLSIFNDIRHLADQCPDFFGYRWSTGLAVLAQFGPMLAKTLTLPGNHGSGLDKEQRILPIRPVSCNP